MKSNPKNDSFHIIKTISGEISLDLNSQDISKKINKIIKSKYIKRKNQKKIYIKQKISISKERKAKSENIIINKNKIDLNPFTLLNNYENKDIISNSHLYKINSNSFSFFCENIKNKNDKNKNQLEDFMNKEIYNDSNNNMEKDKYSLENNIEKNIIYFLKNNFECKNHSNNKYNAYCLICKKNICQDCLKKESYHNYYYIYYFKDIIPTEKQINHLKMLIKLSKNYLKRIREIIIEISAELSELYENEKIIANQKILKSLQRLLKKSYKSFYLKNKYQLIYTETIITMFCNCKDFQFLNYQIIRNLFDIKINSVKIPNLLDKNITEKPQIMIEFMKNENNILSSCDSPHPTKPFCDKDYENNENSEVNLIDMDKYKSFSDLLFKNSEFIYGQKIKNINNFISLFKEDEKMKENKIDENIISKNEDISFQEIKSIININDKNYINDNYDVIKNNFNNKLNLNISNNIINNRNSNITQKSKEIFFSHKEKKKNINNINNIKIQNLIEKEDNLENFIPKDFAQQIKNSIFTNLPNPCPDEVEFKNNIQYKYDDKVSKKEITCIYHGEFKKNTFIRHGRGLFIWEDGEYYLGYWKNDKREGRGTNKYSNGNIYQGTYKNGKKEGKGIYKWKNGDIYEGEWKNDMKDGEGKYNYSNGDKYIGQFKMDKIDGNGTYIWANQKNYKGQFKNNEIEGKGILNYTHYNKNKDINNIHSKINFQGYKSQDMLNINNNNIEIFTFNTNNINYNKKVENEANKKNIK